jgi:hypothetical protein
MLFLKACRKCRGDIMLDSDIYGKYARCLQCGLLTDLAQIQINERTRAEAEPVEELEAA